MPRKKFISRREILPDPKYNEILVAKFINTIMRQGKKSIAESICYGAFDMVREKTSAEPLKLFKTAVENVKPMVEVKSRRVGGASYQVPVDIRPVRRTTLALRWIVQYAKGRPGKSMREKLAGELMDAAEKNGGAFKKKEDTHRMAEANKTFAHYQW